MIPDELLDLVDMLVKCHDEWVRDYRGSYSDDYGGSTKSRVLLRL